MQYRKPYYYSRFNCIADKCPATCCDGWAIVIDDKTMHRYHNLSEDDRSFVLSHVDESEGVFQQCGTRCYFLNEDNLCDLYIRMGEKGFCNTCRRYPRHFEEYGNLVEAALSMSCPVAAKMIVTNDKPDKFVEYKNNKTSPHCDEVDYVMLGGLLGVRSHIFDIINDRGISLQQRIKRVYLFSYKVQKLVYNYEALGIKVKRTKCVSEFLLKLDMLSKKELIHGDSIRVQGEEHYVSKYRQERMKEAVDILLLLENINADWPAMIKEMRDYLYIDMCNAQYLSLSKEFEEYMRNRMYEYEHIFNYFIYTYYLGGVYDFNVHAMTKFAVLAVAVIRDLGMHQWIKAGKSFSEEEQIKICYTYSRQIEHSDDNLTAIEGLLNAHPKLADKNIISII